MRWLEGWAEGLPGDRVWWVLAATAAAPAAVLVYATGYALGVTPDGVIYFDAATRLAQEGRLVAFQYGTVKPVAHFPPLLPGMLSLGLFAGAPILSFARWLNVVLLALTVFGIGAMMHRATERVAPAVLAAVLAGLAADMLSVHAVLLSEALFLPLQVAVLCALAIYLSTGSVPALVAAAVAAGIACLVRFPALALAGCGLIAVLLLRNEAPLRSRLRNASLFAAIAFSPIALWLLTRPADAGSATGRQLAFHPMLGERLRQALTTAGEWLLPQTTLTPRASAALLLLVGVILTWLTARVLRRGGLAASLAAIHVVFAACYCVFLMVSVTLVDAQTPFDARILLPVRLVLVVLFSLGVAELHATAPRVGRAAFAVGLVWMLSAAADMARLATRLHVEGYGYTGRRWTDADFQRLIASTGTSIIYSNAPEAIYFHTGMQARELPASIDRWTRRSNADYDEQMQGARSALDSAGAAIIFFRDATRPFVPDPQQLAAMFDLTSTEWQESIVVLRSASAHRGRVRR